MNNCVSHDQQRGRKPVMEDITLIKETPAIADPVAFFGTCIKSAANVVRSNESGSTLALVHITTDNRITIANIGDTKILMFARNKSSNEILFNDSISREHPLFEKGLGETYLQGFGVFNDRPDISQLTFSNGEVRTETHDIYFAILSDGIFEAENATNNFSELVKNHILSKKPFQDLAASINKRALDDGSRDNLSAVIINLNEPRTNDLVAAVLDGRGGTRTALTVKTYLEKALDQTLLTTRSWKSALNEGNTSGPGKRKSL